MIKFFDIYKQDKIILRKNLREFENVIKKSNFINGDPVKKFEKKFAKYCGTKYAIGCNSGTDALFLALKSLDLKKKIRSNITSSNLLFNSICSFKSKFNTCTS